MDTVVGLFSSFGLLLAGVAGLAFAIFLLLYPWLLYCRLYRIAVAAETSTHAILETNRLLQHLNQLSLEANQNRQKIHLQNTEIIALLTQLESKIEQGNEVLYQIALNGTPAGTCTLSTIRQMIARNELTVNDYYYCERENDWMPISGLLRM